MSEFERRLLFVLFTLEVLLVCLPPPSVFVLEAVSSPAGTMSVPLGGSSPSVPGVSLGVGVLGVGVGVLGESLGLPPDGTLLATLVVSAAPSTVTRPRAVLCDTGITVKLLKVHVVPQNLFVFVNMQSEDSLARLLKELDGIVTVVDIEGKVDSETIILVLEGDAPSSEDETKARVGSCLVDGSTRVDGDALEAAPCSLAVLLVPFA